MDAQKTGEEHGILQEDEIRMAIRAEHINYLYGEGTAFEQYALRDVSFEIGDGGCAAPL